MTITVQDLFDLSQLPYREIFDGVTQPWEALTRLKGFIPALGATLSEDFEQVAEGVWVGKGTTIDKTVTLKGPAIIGRNCELRSGAYIRENVLVGDGVVVGNSTEIKNSILFNNVQAPHFNYVGDSILGYKAHIGAGVILSNLKSTGSLVRIKYGGGSVDTGLRKLGALLGDWAEVGCNSVCNPGTVVGRHSIVYPLTSVKGYIPAQSILKDNGQLVTKTES